MYVHILLSCPYLYRIHLLIIPSLTPSYKNSFSPIPTFPNVHCLSSILIISSKSFSLTVLTELRMFCNGFNRISLFATFEDHNMSQIASNSSFLGFFYLLSLTFQNTVRESDFLGTMYNDYFFLKDCFNP